MKTSIINKYGKMNVVVHQPTIPNPKEKELGKKKKLKDDLKKPISDIDKKPI